jgi:hypothetical protein
MLKHSAFTAILVLAMLAVLSPWLVNRAPYIGDSRINEFKSYVDARINDVNTRMSDLYGVMKASLVAIVVTLASTILVPLIIRIFF